METTQDIQVFGSSDCGATGIDNNTASVVLLAWVVPMEHRIYLSEAL